MRELSKVRKRLIEDLGYDDDAKSSHWRFHVKNARIDKEGRIKGIDGFSVRSKKFLLSNLIHARAQRRIFPNYEGIKSSKWWKVAMKICDLQNRSLDSCVLRHVYTFNLLEEKGIFERIQDGGLGRVCVIGDGQSNFVSMALVDSRFAKLISINLTETLLSDLDLVEKLPLKDGVVQLASSKKELEILLKDTSTKLILLRANDVEYLKNSQIDLFVNIASFQEMKKATINDYFEVAKNNKSYLYCCNREAKVLYGGEVIEFRNYPWGEYKEQILSEECPWHRYFYSLRSAKLFKRLEYDGRILHRLVKY